MRHPVLPAALSILLCACGDPPPPVKTADAGGSGASDRTDGGGADALVRDEPVELDESSLDSWLAVMKKIRGESQKASERLGEDPNALTGYLTGLDLRGKYKDILDEHDLTEQSFLDLSHKISAALAAVLMEEQQASTDDAMATQIEAMKNMPGISEEQLAQARVAMDRARGQMDSLAKGATEETKELIRRYRSKLEAALR